MAYNYYETHTLIASVQGLDPVHSFLRDRYFPTNESADIFATDDVLVEYSDGDATIAPFVAPRIGGITIRRQGYTMERYTPPFIAPRRPLTIDDLRKRGFGEALHTDLTPAQRQGVIMLKDLDDMRKMIVRRQEQMAAETMLDNGCVMRHYTDDLTKFDDKEICFYDGENNPAQYTPSVSWDTATWAQKYEDLAAMIYFLTERGLPATDLLCSRDTGSNLLHDEGFMKQLDNKNFNIGGVDPVVLPDGVAKIGRINVYGHFIDILCYEDTYKDFADGKRKPYIPAGTLVITAPGAGRMLFGAVTQLEQGDGEFHTYTGMYVPKYLSDADANTRSLTLSSCPVAIPRNKNPWISSKVIF